MRFAIHQFNPTVGALEDNANKLMAAITVAINNFAEIFVSSELSLCGYIPQDLLFRPDFHKQIKTQLDKFLEVRGITMLIGAPYYENDCCYNSVFVIKDGKIIARHDKQKMPNYEVFDEERYFDKGSQATVFPHNGKSIGVIICEDLWHPEPSLMAKEAKADILIAVNASPFSINKYKERIKIAKQRVSEINIPLIYVNQLGGQDDLVFDGGSFVLDKDGQLISQFPAFTQELNYFNLESNITDNVLNLIQYPDEEEAVYNALVLATRDYIIKNGFKGAMLGLSGGIDSALTLAIAVDAIGAEKVMTVMMPSVYTADISLIDARDMANRLEVEYHEIKIDPIFNKFKEQLQPTFDNLESKEPFRSQFKLSIDTTDENLQARSRGVLLMAISNKTGYIVLTTGNKSEMATGYATLYGDMAGGFAVLKDVPKTLVYRLSKWRNKQKEIIPTRIITRAPSAELKENQVDQDSLPAYDILDKIIELLVEDKLSSSEVIAQGYDDLTVKKVARLIKINEYKRHQSAIGPKITKCGFTKDWRYPITNGFQF